MGDISDLLKDIGNSNTDPIKFLGDAFGTIGQFSGYIGTAVGIVNFLVGKGDPTQMKLDAILNTINQDFKILQAEQRAKNIIDKLTNLGDQLSTPLAIFDDLPNLLKMQPALSPADARDKIESCHAGVLALAPDVNWRQVYSDQIYWTDDAIGLQAPAGSSNDLVFSYTYILPAYLQALFIFLTVAASLDPNFPMGYEQRIRDAAALLEDRHDKINKEGIRLVGTAIDMPGQDWVLAMEDSRDPRYSGWRYGAVEVFSGYSAIAVMKLAPSDPHVSESEPDLPLPGTGGPYPVSAVYKARIRYLRKAKEVYLGVGLGAVWNTINSLNRVVGDPPLPRPNFGAPFSYQITVPDWSFREINDHILIPEAPSPPMPPGAPLSLRAVAHILSDSAPLDTLPAPPYAFRNLLEPDGM